MATPPIPSALKRRGPIPGAQHRFRVDLCYRVAELRDALSRSDIQACRSLAEDLGAFCRGHGTGPAARKTVLARHQRIGSVQTLRSAAPAPRADLVDILAKSLGLQQAQLAVADAEDAGVLRRIGERVEFAEEAAVA